MNEIEHKLPPTRELFAWVRHTKAIQRAYGERGGYTDLTIGWCPRSGEWGAQTGDNSYVGAAYHYPVWAVVSVGAATKARMIVVEIHEQLADLASQGGFDDGN